tara:strand:+ start:467 stop:1234 length:768 start_codon:yes stop_codon:yes gene_type:complete
MIKNYMKNSKILSSLRMKNLIYRLSILTLSTLFISCSDKNKEEWTYIFDGETFNGWHSYDNDSVGNQWSIENGELIFTNNDKESGHDILTEKEYTSFELSLEWNVSKGGNSGIFYGVKQIPEFSAFSTGPEIQILDNANGYAGSDLEYAPSLFDLVKTDNPNLKFNGHGNWNHVIIKIDHVNNLGTVKFNGELAFTYPLSGPEWDKLVSKSKFAIGSNRPDATYAPDFGKFKTGKIALQDHSTDVKFRNIKIREL